jgi:predicted transcriptional regulator
VPRGRGKVTIEVSRELRDRIRELAEKHGLLYEELLWKALDAFTQNSARGEEGAGSRRGGAGAGGGHVWCREKGRVGGSAGPPEVG